MFTQSDDPVARPETEAEWWPAERNLPASWSRKCIELIRTPGHRPRLLQCVVRYATISPRVSRSRPARQLHADGRNEMWLSNAKSLCALILFGAHEPRGTAGPAAKATSGIRVAHDESCLTQIARDCPHSNTRIHMSPNRPLLHPRPTGLRRALGAAVALLAVTLTACTDTTSPKANLLRNRSGYLTISAAVRTNAVIDLAAMYPTLSSVVPTKLPVP